MKLLVYQQNSLRQSRSSSIGVRLQITRLGAATGANGLQLGLKGPGSYQSVFAQLPYHFPFPLHGRMGSIGIDGHKRLGDREVRLLEFPVDVGQCYLRSLTNSS